MRTSQKITLITSLAVALTLAAGSALAHGRGGPCRQDIQALCPNITPGPGSFRDCLKSLCPNVTPGPGSFVDCLEQNAAKLSPACQTRLSQMKAKIAAWQQACQGDVQKFCSDVSPGHGNVIKCLHQHRADLSQSCQDQLAEHRGHHDHHRPTPTPGQ
jgi:cysteine rich repeat protein